MNKFPKRRHFPPPRRTAMIQAAAGMLLTMASCSSPNSTSSNASLVQPAPVQSSPTQLYPGVRLAPEKVATLTAAPSRKILTALYGAVSGFAGTNARPFIIDLNGSAIGMKAIYGPIEILPGAYVAKLGCESSEDGSYLVANGGFAGGVEQVKFVAVAGRRYIAEIDGENIATEVGGKGIKCRYSVKETAAVQQ